MWNSMSDCSEFEALKATRKANSWSICLQVSSQLKVAYTRRKKQSETATNNHLDIIFMGDGLAAEVLVNASATWKIYFRPSRACVCVTITGCGEKWQRKPETICGTSIVLFPHGAVHSEHVLCVFPVRFSNTSIMGTNKSAANPSNVRRAGLGWKTFPQGTRWKSVFLAAGFNLLSILPTTAKQTRMIGWKEKGKDVEGSEREREGIDKHKIPKTNVTSGQVRWDTARHGWSLLTAALDRLLPRKSIAICPVRRSFPSWSVRSGEKKMKTENEAKKGVCVKKQWEKRAHKKRAKRNENFARNDDGRIKAEIKVDEFPCSTHTHPFRWGAPPLLSHRRIRDQALQGGKSSTPNPIRLLIGVHNCG